MQTDGSRRFDLYVAPQESDRVLRVISDKWDRWRIQRHISYLERRQREGVPRSRRARDHLTVMTWNANWIMLVGVWEYHK